MRKSIYVFVDDGYPEAQDYDTNYLSYGDKGWFEEEAKKKDSHFKTKPPKPSDELMPLAP